MQWRTEHCSPTSSDTDNNCLNTSTHPGYLARQTTSPSNPILSASLASSHSHSFFFVLTTAISPMPSGFTALALLPEHTLPNSWGLINTLLLGRLTRAMALRTGASARYLSSAHMRCSAGDFEASKSTGEGEVMVPRVREERKPARRRMERMPRFWVVCGTAMCVCRARKAFWRRAQRS